MTRTSILPEVRPYALILLALAALGAVLWPPAAIGFICLLCFVVYFFRDPERTIPEDDGVVVAPADGRVIGIERLSHHPAVNGPATKLTIFLSLLDVHVNRAPTPGIVVRTTHSKGRKYPANWRRAGSSNERNDILLDSPHGPVLVTQIAGIVGRRIVQWIGAGSPVAMGQKIGMIKFSSRTELVLPGTAPLHVSRGEKVKAGETILCRLG